jgi:hypothetical protein
VLQSTPTGGCNVTVIHRLTLQQLVELATSRHCNGGLTSLLLKRRSSAPLKCITLDDIGTCTRLQRRPAELPVKLARGRLELSH